MELEANKALVRRYFEELPDDPEVCDEIFQPRFIFRSLQYVTLTSENESTLESEK